MQSPSPFEKGEFLCFNNLNLICHVKNFYTLIFFVSYNGTFACNPQPL